MSPSRLIICGEIRQPTRDCADACQGSSFRTRRSHLSGGIRYCPLRPSAVACMPDVGPGRPCCRRAGACRLRRTALTWFDTTRSRSAWGRALVCERVHTPGRSPVAEHRPLFLTCWVAAARTGRCQCRTQRKREILAQNAAPNCARSCVRAVLGRGNPVSIIAKVAKEPASRPGARISARTEYGPGPQRAVFRPPPEGLVARRCASRACRPATISFKLRHRIHGTAILQISACAS
jgi:hypothetical protein